MHGEDQCALALLYVTPSLRTLAFRVRGQGSGYIASATSPRTWRNKLELSVIPTSVHGVLDYLASGINLVFPKVLGLHDAPWAALVPRIDGAAGAGYSLITDYELGAFKVLPMPTHLVFDAAKGLFMAASPWLFGFAKNGTRYWLPHVLMGTADVAVALATRTR
jgi:hypothetical protein